MKDYLLKDCDIRQALYDDVLKKHIEEPDTIVLNELGLLQGTCRADIAVINGSIHGYEIKSEADTLDRLPMQKEVYSSIFDRATLVVGENHLNKAIDIIPDWWGIRLVRPKKDGSIKLTQYRKDKVNKNVDPYSLVQLLWKNEVVDILATYDIPAKTLRRNKSELYDILIEVLPLKSLKILVRDTMKSREKWRDR